MSYNGIGLRTARGSATNGYVQANQASRSSIGQYAGRQERESKRERDEKIFSSTNIAERYIDQGILDHDRKRQVEVECYELRDKLEEAGDVEEEEIEKQVAELKAKLLKDLNENSKVASSTHALAQAKVSANEKLQNALSDFRSKKVYRYQENRSYHKRRDENRDSGSGKPSEVDRRGDIREQRPYGGRRDRGSGRWDGNGRGGKWSADDWEERRSRSRSRSPPRKSAERSRSGSPVRRYRRRSRSYDRRSRSPSDDGKSRSRSRERSRSASHDRQSRRRPRSRSPSGNGRSGPKPRSRSPSGDGRSGPKPRSRSPSDDRRSGARPRSRSASHDRQSRRRPRSRSPSNDRRSGARPRSRSPSGDGGSGPKPRSRSPSDDRRSRQRPRSRPPRSPPSYDKLHTSQSNPQTNSDPPLAKSFIHPSRLQSVENPDSPVRRQQTKQHHPRLSSDNPNSVALGSKK